MRISASDMVAGQPILLIRKLLREAQYQGADVALTRRVLQVDAHAANHILKELSDQGYMLRDATAKGQAVWHNTVKGNALANATAAKPIMRTTAQRLVQEFLARVHEVNTDPNLVYGVAKVVVFGSYLSDKATINDIDLAVALLPKYADAEEMRTQSQHRIEQAFELGRSFNNIVDQVTWPRREVEHFLKGRSRAISLHELGAEEQLLSSIPTQVVFERDANRYA